MSIKLVHEADNLLRIIPKLPLQPLLNILFRIPINANFQQIPYLPLPYTASNKLLHQVPIVLLIPPSQGLHIPVSQQCPVAQDQALDDEGMQPGWPFFVGAGQDYRQAGFVLAAVYGQRAQVLQEGRLV